MASMFDIAGLLNPEALNRLLQPLQNAQGVQNMLMNTQAAAPAQFDPTRFAGGPGQGDRAPAVGVEALRERMAPQLPAPVDIPMQQVAEAPQVDPWAGMREQDVVRVDPMTTGASAPAQPQSFGQKYQDFWNSDRGQFLGDLFTGWAAGSTPQESLAYGAKLAAGGKRDRQSVNQTVEWLKGKGMDEQQAKFLASSPPALNEYLQSLREASDPKRTLEIAKLQQELNGGTVKVVGDKLVRVSADGTPEDITPRSGNANGEFRFSGSSVEAQSLNGLLDAKVLTPDQAQQLGAGKTITGPNGEIIFMTPQGVFGQPPGGGAAQPVGAPQQYGGNIQVTGPKATVDERKAMTFADRMAKSGDIIDNIGSVGADSVQKSLGRVPVFGNYLVTEDYQKQDQAKRDFINAQLRRESGAVISPEEFDNANKQYFPQPGDGPEVLKQKAENRRVAIDGMIRDAGPTYGSGAQAPAPQGASPSGAVVDYRTYFGGQ